MTYEDLNVEWNNSTEIECQTSGSTGNPKIIRLPKIQMLRSARRTAEFFGLTKDSLLYSCISPDYIGGKMMFVRQQLLSCKFAWETPSNKPLQDYKGDTISMLSVVPSQMLYILDHITEMPEIQNILIGGSSIPVSLRKRIVSSGLNAYESYGMTETSSHIAIRKIQDGDEPFKTLGDITVDNYNEALEINIPGWQKLRTNDVAHILSPSEFFILGRLDNVIISGGLKINPERIEDKLSPFIEYPFIVTSVPDEKWGQRIILIAECKDTMRDNISEICHRVLDSYERPKEIHTVSSIARTPNGKIIRKYDQIR